jgi:membrane protease YdiL (CAAX protease family)
MKFKKVFLFAECLVLFFMLPIVLFFIRHKIAPHITPMLLILSFACAWHLFGKKDFDRRMLWDPEGSLKHLRAMLFFFLPAASLITVATYVFLKPYFFGFPSSKPWLWLIVMITYPILAAYPQELIFRTFFFYRYQHLFPNRTILILTNALSFSLAHLFYNNWIAPTLSFFGGILFAYRYLKSGSLPGVAIEHSLWGNFLFTVGIGWYFHSGSIS